MLPKLPQLTSLIRDTARTELLSRFRRISASLKDDGSLLTEADLAMQTQLQQQLAHDWPDIPFLGEEMPREQQLELLTHSEQGLWVVDPIDGTTNFSLGIPYFAVSVALIVQGQIQLAVVYDPSRDECFHAERGQGAFLNQQKLDLSNFAGVTRLTVASIDFKRLPAELATRLVAQPPYQSQRSFGSVALDWCWFAAGRGDVYLHGAQNLWDYAAGHLILQEAGGYSCTLQGEPVYNGELEKRSALIAINASLFEQWRSFLRG